MFERVYKNPIAKSEEGKAEMLMETLYQHFLKHLDDLPEEYLNLLSVGEPREKVVCDYVGAICHSGIRGYLHTEILAEIGTR